MTTTDQVTRPSATETSSLAADALRGTIWTVGAYGAGQLFRLGSNIILTRLLAPQYFGLMALLNTVIVGMHLFADFGLAPSVVRSEYGDSPTYLDTVWTVQILRGAALCMIAASLSWPIARFYGDLSLVKLICVLSLTFVIDGCSSTSLITFARHMEVRKLVTVEISMQALFLVVAVSVALIRPSVWALVAGRGATSVARMIISHLLIPGFRNKLRLDKESVRDLLSFGKWVFLSTALTFLASQSDRLVLGKLVSMTTLGLYGIAFALADVPRQVISAFSARVAFPFVSRFRHLKPGEFRSIVRRYRRLVLLAGAIILALGVSFSDLFILHVYDNRYHNAAWIVPVLALGLWHTILYCTIQPCLTAIGKMQYHIAGYAATAIIMLVAVPVAFHQRGLTGAVWVISFADLPVYVSTTYGMCREELSLIGQDIQMTIVFVVFLVGFFMLRLALRLPWPHSVPLH